MEFHLKQLHEGFRQNTPVLQQNLSKTFMWQMDHKNPYGETMTLPILRWVDEHYTIDRERSTKKNCTEN